VPVIPLQPTSQSTRLPAALRYIPGVALAAGVMLLALWVSGVLGQWLLAAQGLDPANARSPVSGVTIAIVLGVVIRNIRPLPTIFMPGVAFSVERLLRAGVICIGIKLSLFDVMRLGAWGVPVVVAAITSGLVFVTWFNRRLKLPARLGTLIAAGTGICGVTAIVSVAPAINANEDEVAYAVANITLFGLIGMLCYPYVAPLLLATSEQIGLFLGTAIHDTSQVVGSALTYRALTGDEVAFQSAIITKLTRNLFLAVVVPLSAAVYIQGSGASETRRVSARHLLPAFVLGFVLMALLRTVADATASSDTVLGVLPVERWRWLTRQVGEVWGAKYLLGTAMGAVGLSTRLGVFKSVGLRPFAVGMAGALVVGIVGLLMAHLVGRFVHM